MRRNPERLAWTVLLASFVAFAAFIVACPLSVHTFLTDSTDPAVFVLNAQQGIALLQRPNSADFEGIRPDKSDEVPEGSTITIDDSAQAILSVHEPQSDNNLAIISLYSETDLVARSAQSPRFEASPNPHRISLFVNNGRIRVNVPPDSSRPIAVSVRSPQGEVTFAAGIFAIEVSNQDLQVTAREGNATVTAQGTSVVIEPSQRAVVPLGRPPQGGLSGERPLIINGSFTDSINPAWSIEHNPQGESEPTGSVKLATIVGRRAALFERVGNDHAETRLVQRLNRDVTDATSLTLHFAVLVSGQDVAVCGPLGTECPMMVKIDYIDTSGANREWLRGFYFLNDESNNNQPFCGSCARRFQHERIQRDVWFNYDSGNLMEMLTIDDARPTRITRLIFYASGHSYRSAVTDVELLVQD